LPALDGRDPLEADVIVIVVGAGLAGLTAMAALADAGAARPAPRQPR
jgi:predicted oxidoreductase